MCRVGLGPSVVVRAVVLSLISWLPLLVLSVFQGVAFGDQVRLPFLLDIAAYIRFLIAIPILILVEPTINKLLRLTVEQFPASGLIQNDERDRFDSAIGLVTRLRDSALAEILMLVLAYIGSLSVGGGFLAGLSTWYAVVSESGRSLTAPGWWYRLVSIPLFQFLMYRWLWRYVIWSVFLWRMSRLNLQLTAAHPDRAAGLGFVGLNQTAFTPIVFAAFSVLASIISMSVIYAGKALLSYRFDIIILIILIILIFLGPLLFFARKLIRARIRSLLDYGTLASRYTQAFDLKWIQGGASDEDKLLGTPDMQSLADLIGSYDAVRRIRVIPFGLPQVLVYALSALIPMLPLLLLIMPASEIFQGLLRIIRSILG